MPIKPRHEAVGLLNPLCQSICHRFNYLIGRYLSVYGHRSKSHMSLISESNIEIPRGLVVLVITLPVLTH